MTKQAAVRGYKTIRTAANKKVLNGSSGQENQKYVYGTCSLECGAFPPRV